MAAANNKTQLTDDSVDKFLSSVADEQQRADSIKVCEMMQISTGEKPKMWGAAIVGFGLRHLKYESGREMDWMEIGFSPRKGKFAFYGLTGSANADELLPKLGKHKTGKGCLYVKRLSDVNEGVLEELVRASLTHIISKK